MSSKKKGTMDSLEPQTPADQQPDVSVLDDSISPPAQGPVERAPTPAAPMGRAPEATATPVPDKKAGLLAELAGLDAEIAKIGDPAAKQRLAANEFKAEYGRMTRLIEDSTKTRDSLRGELKTTEKQCSADAERLRTLNEQRGRLARELAAVG